MNLIFLWWLCLGALIGWLVQWVWDWMWFRARRRIVSEEVESSVTSLQAERTKLAADLRACGDRRVALEGELNTLRGQVGELNTLRGQVGDLDRLRVRVGELEPLTGHVDTLSADNAQLRAELEVARAAAAENDRLRAELEAARGAAVAGTTLGLTVGNAQAERELGGDNSATLVSLREYNLSMHDELEATRRALARFSAGSGDPLIDIDGIGPVYQKKLYEQGVVTFDQVATMHPERLRSLVAPNAVFDLDTASWSEQARRMTATPTRDPLIDINGIGPVYEQRLLNAGVTTFAQLATLSAEELRAIIRPAGWQLIEPDAWIEEARELAAQVRAGTYRKGEY